MNNKKSKVKELKEFNVRDNLKGRNLTMSVFDVDSMEFEKTSCFYRRVEMAKKIVDSDTGEVYKNRVE